MLIKLISVCIVVTLIMLCVYKDYHDKGVEHDKNSSRVGHTPRLEYVTIQSDGEVSNVRIAEMKPWSVSLSGPFEEAPRLVVKQEVQRASGKLDFELYRLVIEDGDARPLAYAYYQNSKLSGFVAVNHSDIEVKVV